MGKKVIKDIPLKAKGESLQYDPTFKGPIKNRSCTDIICLFLLLAFIVCWIILAIFAFTRGDPRLLLYPTDSKGELCGEGTKLDRPFLFFFDITKCIPKGTEIRCRTPQVCVKMCPNETYSAFDPNISRAKLICKEGIDPTVTYEEIASLVNKESCAAYYLTSGSVLNRCIPRSKVTNLIIGESHQKLNFSQVEEGLKGLGTFLKAAEVGEKIFQDLSKSYKVIIIAFFFAMILSLLWIVLMRWLAGFMVYFSILVVLSLLVFGCYFCIDRYLQPALNTTIAFETFMTTSSEQERKNVWLAFGIISGVLALIIILVILFLRNRIRIAIALIRESSRAVGHMMMSLLFPIIPFIFLVAVFVFWGSIALYLASQSDKIFVPSTIGTGETEKNISCSLSDVDYHKCVFDKYATNANMNRAQIFNLFGLLWGTQFVIGASQVTLAGAFASYYWAFNKPADIPALPILSSLGRTIRYHLGSVAFGALIIAIVQLIRIMLEYIQSKVKESENPCAKFCVKCMICCFWCLEKFLKFINKNAYIMIAIYGKNFCTSAKNAFSLLMRNALRVVVLDNVTDFLLFVGKLVIVGSTGVATFVIFSRRVAFLQDYVPNLNYYLVPVLIVIIGSYLIASAFFSVYSMAVDTIFLCFLEDCERNDGTPEKPYYMSKDLMKILGKKNQ